VLFELPLIPGTLIRRYKRFLADVRLESGEIITAHCPNSGSMKGVNVPGSDVLLSYHPHPGRKYSHTWEMIRLESGWVGINTLIANRLFAEAFQARAIPELRKFRHLRAEMKISEDTRIDFALGEREQCLVEVKNVTLVESGVARFPDSVTTRGAKHVHHLIRHAEQGGTAVAFFVVQHSAGEIFSPADDIDPQYGAALRKAAATGVKILAWQARVSPQEIRLDHAIPVRL